MDNLKKLGLSALAGSLVAFSANAGELSVSGGAKLSYVGDSGNEDNAVDGNRFGMQRLVTMSGSGDLDNGMSVSLTHTFATSTGDGSTSVITLDMGSMGTLGYGQDSYQVGISKIDDIVPTAVEEVSDGISLNATESATGAKVAGNTYEVDLGGNGFNYSLAMGDMATIVLGVSPGGQDSLTDDGSNSGTRDGDGSDKSAHIVLNPMDGLTIAAATGEDNSSATAGLDLTQMYATYTMDAISVGVHMSESDSETANADKDFTALGISYAVSEDMSVSLNTSTIEYENSTLSDQEATAVSISYTMGSMTLSGNMNQVDNIAGTSTDDRSGYSFTLGFAF